jgi:glycosyltransferase involved in cell wall biosynthesis
MTNNQSLTILLVCDNTIHLKYRSGIQRVVVETVRAMADRCNLRLVKWDERDGQLRDLDAHDLHKLFGDDIPAGFAPHPACQRVGFRFVDTIEEPENSWLLYTEVPHEIPKGPQKLAAMRAQLREVGVRSALVFYDLIPVLEKEYMGARSKHLEYMTEAVLCDRIFPISKFAGDDLLEFLADSADLGKRHTDRLRDRIVPAPLGEYRENQEWGLPRYSGDEGSTTDEPRMIMVGTVEPRKQQVRLLRAINDARSRVPELRSLNIDIFGSLYPDCAEPLQTELERNPRITYHRYASDDAIERAYATAQFSAFVSKHEGYGLPIVESLRHGVPCLTASFGAMAEVGAEGGCLLVDTRKDHEMVKGVQRLLTEPELPIRLKKEIAERPKRSWGDYAQQIVDDLGRLSEVDRDAEAAFASAVEEALSAHKITSRTLDLHGVGWTITSDPASAAANADRQSGESASLLLLNVAPKDELLGSVAEADILVGRDASVRAKLLAATDKASLDRLLPTDAFFGSEAAEQAVVAAIALSRTRGRAFDVRDETQMRRRLLKAYWRELPQPPEKLAIVLSTYNRGSFVEHNVEWILGQIDRDQLPVRCVVVDNASSDDTFQRLQRFAGHPNFALVENANNVGMLGNLRVCAAGLFAPYVWLTGDDDFIVPGRIQAVLEAIERNPGLPLLVHNFAVYHRPTFGPNDRAQHFLHEKYALAPNPETDGIRPINEIAGEHDNLYTAIYPLVFRSDVLAACFDYPFTGVPFGDLTECVPTTKLLLGSYRYADAMWFAEIGIVGNAHNSWSAHRPRWHLVLMPLVLQLARDAGVDPERVWEWLQGHLPLFEEAVGMCTAKDLAAHLDVPQDLAFAKWCFRREFELDDQLKLAVPSVITQWAPATEQPL